MRLISGTQVDAVPAGAASGSRPLVLREACRGATYAGSCGPPRAQAPLAAEVTPRSQHWILVPLALVLLVLALILFHVAELKT
jgi:hypothetical protein